MSETTGRIDREKKRLRALPYMGPEAGWDEVLTLIDDHDRLEEALATAIRETREGSPDWEKLWEEQSERAEALQAERDRAQGALKELAQTSEAVRKKLAESKVANGDEYKGVGIPFVQAISKANHVLNSLGDTNGEI